MNMFSGFSVLRLKNGIFVGFQSYSSFGFCKRYVFEGIVWLKVMSDVSVV